MPGKRQGHKHWATVLGRACVGGFTNVTYLQSLAKAHQQHEPGWRRCKAPALQVSTRDVYSGMGQNVRDHLNLWSM